MRRASFDDEDLFLAYIAGMDTFAKGLKIAARLFEDQVLEDYREKRYAGYTTGIGKIINNQVDFKQLDCYIKAKKSNQMQSNRSGCQEYLESIINQNITEDGFSDQNPEDWLKKVLKF